jgi:hypothetical protein
MMPYEAYRLYQIEHAASDGEARRVGEQEARLASAVSALVRGITRPVRAARRQHTASRSVPHPA